ncbi:MAG: protein translocase subunit SecD [Steroidobacteraceae bacterium]|nr:protein translocase subunit SecD [Steroidobacteraceae bacterium]
MNRYPLWKSLLFAVTMLIALLLALPNVFGEAPALQLSRKDGELFEGADAVQPFADLLTREKVTFDDAHTADGRVVIRFPDVPTQLRARDVLEASAPGRYAIATTFASRAPAWVRAIGLKPMSLGLDLRGGIYIMYEVDVDGAVRQTLQRLERDYRTKLRDERIQYVSVDSTATSVTVTLRDAAQLEAARAALQEVDTEVTISAVPGATDVGVLRTTLTDEQVAARQDFAIQQNITALSNRVNALGVSEASVQRQGVNRIAVQLPGVQDASEVIRLLGKTATLEFRLVDTTGNPVEAQQTGRAPLGTRLYRERNGQPVLLKRDVIATGDQLTDATSSLSEGEPAVNVRLDARGGEEMLRTTRENLGRPMAVVFIERERQQREVNGQKQVVDVTTEEVISVATIRGVFSNQFQITGLTVREGQELAKLLRAGALAAPVYIVEQRLIGPSLGQDNIDQGVQALLWGCVALFVWMIVYYRWFGLVANAVLLCNVVLIAAMLSLFGAALTLPGIAGIVLTVGMAVDANILIYERMREELRIGNSPQGAIKAGFEKAFSAILDANITTFIAGLVLFLFGTGPIKGFAITLCIGIGTTMFTAVVGSRAIITLIWGGRARLAALPV